MVTKSNGNLYNEFQRYCSLSNIPKSQVKGLYVKHKNALKNTNPSLWDTIVDESPLQDYNAEETTEQTLVEKVEEHTTENHLDFEKTIKDVYVTLSEIKSFLIYLCSEPSRHIKAYVTLEEKTDENILLKWSSGMNQIMGELSRTKELINGTSNLIIDIKQVYCLIKQFLFPTSEVDKIGSVTFLNIFNESDVRKKLLFDLKRKKYCNEFIIPVVTRNEIGKNAIYFFYNSRELLNLIEHRYSTEMMYHSEYISTAQLKVVEQEYFLTQMIYIVLHGMIHLHCSVHYNNSYLDHSDHNYYKTIENLVPKTLFRYFLTPNLK